MYHKPTLREKCPNTEFILVHIQSECGKIWIRNNSVFGQFLHNATYTHQHHRRIQNSVKELRRSFS